MSLLISFRGPRRRQILLPSKGGRSQIDAGSMSGRASGELRITRQARWIVTLELLETSLRLSWSPLGVPETSRASKSDAKSLSDANLSSQLAFGALKINDFHLFFNGFMNIYVFDLKIVLWALERFCGALLGYFDLHFGSQEAPWELFGGCQRLLESS